jgi:hypothetical protein
VELQPAEIRARARALIDRSKQLSADAEDLLRQATELQRDWAEYKDRSQLRGTPWQSHDGSP